MKKKSLWLAVALLSAGVIQGCQFVEAKPGADKVRVLSKEEARECLQITTTNVKTTAEVGLIKRDDKAVADELERLAINDAVGADADTVVAISEVKDGGRKYIIARCVGVETWCQNHTDVANCRGN